jgi:hypothetical protein
VKDASFGSRALESFRGLLKSSHESGNIENNYRMRLDPVVIEFWPTRQFTSLARIAPEDLEEPLDPAGTAGRRWREHLGSTLGYKIGHAFCDETLESAEVLAVGRNLSLPKHLA